MSIQRNIHSPEANLRTPARKQPGVLRKRRTPRGRIYERTLAGRVIGPAVLLDAVLSEPLAGTEQTLTMFFAPNSDVSQITSLDGCIFRTQQSVGGAPIVTYTVPPGTGHQWSLAGHPLRLHPAMSELPLFTGLNCIAAVRNGETVQTILTWLAHHAQQQDLEGIVLLDRAKPTETSNHFAAALARGMSEQGLTCDVVILRSNLPLGLPDQPAEAHPYSVPGAPGKDRMKVPKPDQWKSPLGVLSIYEIMRARFLGNARAIANIDVYDMLVRGKQTVFDTTVMAHGGVVQLVGQQCYPWRIRKDEVAQFADHICVQFDAVKGRTRWCVAPDLAPRSSVWRLGRLSDADPDPNLCQHFFRYMSLRHPNPAIAKIAPKTALVENEYLLEQSTAVFGHKPVRMSKVKPNTAPKGRGRCAIVTTMKNEGPFILEWLAYHRSIGFDDFIIYTNDCTDGTDTLLDLLQAKGLVQHRDNRFREMDRKPQHAALQSAEEEEMILNAKWVTCIDVDEYVNIKVGNGTLDALFDAVPDANMISMTWRLFGNDHVHGYVDAPITEQFLHCAPEMARKPHQAWGFKTLFQTIGLFKKLGVHRPKGLVPQLWKQINWVNGSGIPIPAHMYRNGWRSTKDTYGYDLVQLNHYAVRSAESFLVKRDRGRVNHVDRDQGLAYWFRMNNNAEKDLSIQRRLPAMKVQMADLMADPEIAAAHAYSVACHRCKVAALRKNETYRNFYTELTSLRMEKLSKLHTHFGANVFLSGPGVVPDTVLSQTKGEDWFFTVDGQGAAQH